MTERSAYREGAVPCPACAALMRVEHTPSGQVEVCDACEGVFIDWFEGEVHAVAVEVEAARRERGTPLPSRASAPPSSGSKTCPRCQTPLVAELYPFFDAKRDDLITGVELLRCAECAGAFVPRSSAHLLLERATEQQTQTPLEALQGLLQRLWVKP